VDFGEQAVLTSCSLSVSAGSTTAVVGPSGCGKSTFLRSVAGLIQPARGTIAISGTTVFSATDSVEPHLRGVGMMFQSPAVLPYLDVLGNVMFPLPGRRAGRQRQALEALELVGIDHLAHRRIGEISGGEIQRMCLAAALVTNPRVMLLDEPFSAVDQLGREAIRDAVFDVLHKQAITTVIVTHDQAEALEVADQVAVMDQGTFVDIGSPRRIYDDPRTVRSAQLTGAVSVVPVAEAAVLCAKGQPLDGIPVVDGMALIRPGRVRVSTSGVPCEVKRVRFSGARRYVELQAGAHHLVMDWIEARMPEPGEKIPVHLVPLANWKG
jgi:iron(III) transport system ATP-binding protein